MIHDHIDELVSQGITLPKDADQTGNSKVLCVLEDSVFD